MASIKELSARPELMTGGHRLCAGCGAGIMARQVLLAASKYKIVATSATGCLEVSTTIFPFTSWKTAFFHSAFENSAATCSGIESAYKAMKRQGRVTEDMRFIAFGGDGGTYDIGLQSLSGAMERGHRMLYICYDNQAYMNTGIQRSSASPRGSHTTTAPSGKASYGKQQFRKDLTEIMVAHHIPYVAQTSIGNWRDLINKVEKALEADGPSFINIYTPCRLGWGYDPSTTIDLAKLVADTCAWPLYEVVNGEHKLTYKPKEKKPYTEYLKLQDRFKHLFKPGNEALLQELQVEVDRRWNRILKLCSEQTQ